MYANMSAYLCVCLYVTVQNEKNLLVDLCFLCLLFRIIVRNRDELPVILTSKTGNWKDFLFLVMSM